MLKTVNGLTGNVRKRSTEFLADSLLHLVDLERDAKRAHWNFKGLQFIASHELFDRVASARPDVGDTVTERLVARGGVADARSEMVAIGVRLASFPLSSSDCAHHITAVATALAFARDLARDVVDQSSGCGDAGTSNVLAEVLRGVDKLLWLVEAHRDEAVAP
jgi:starvation-inducible DNA-binding protein